MRRLNENFGRYLMFLALAFFAVGVTSCDGDDDVDDIIEPEEPIGAIVAVDQTVVDNTIVVQTVSVEQDSWLVALKAGEPNNVISDTVMVDDDVNPNVILTIDENADLTEGEAGTEITLMLYADNPDEGTLGELDARDEEVMNADGTSASETITIFVDETTAIFADFDTDEDGVLDSTEVTGIYENNFDLWDADGDGVLSRDEFDATTFSLTDMNDDEGIDEDEWDDGFVSFFGNWNENDFDAFDVDDDGLLDTTEWNDAFADSEWFGTFDADNDDFVGEDEWDAGLFDDWDADDNDAIDEDEFDVFSPFAWNW